MASKSIDAIKVRFQSRLKTLDHLLKSAQSHFKGDESFLQERLISDRLPLGTQVAFTCNQPYHFALWCGDKPKEQLDPEVTSLAQACEHVANTLESLAGLDDIAEAKLAEIAHIDLGEGLYLELTGEAYVNDFLLPNFYFHLVTAYDILRMMGVPIGKRDYMMHLVPFLKQS